MFMPVLASELLDPPFYRKRGFKNFIFLLGHPLARAHRARLVPFSHCRGESKRDAIRRVKYWELIADNLIKEGWSWGCVATVDREGRTIWIANAHRGDGKRFVVHADEKLTAFVEFRRSSFLEPHGEWFRKDSRG
jgi:hypothetical protein